MKQYRIQQTQVKISMSLGISYLNDREREREGGDKIDDSLIDKLRAVTVTSQYA